MKLVFLATLSLLGGTQAFVPPAMQSAPKTSMSATRAVGGAGKGSFSLPSFGNKKAAAPEKVDAKLGVKGTRAIGKPKKAIAKAAASAKPAAKRAAPKFPSFGKPKTVVKATAPATKTAAKKPAFSLPSLGGAKKAAIVPIVKAAPAKAALKKAAWKIDPKKVAASNAKRAANQPALVKAALAGSTSAPTAPKKKVAPLAKKKDKNEAVASTIFNMDLWKDRVADGTANDYGGRGAKQKKFGWGKVGKVKEGASYVPDGLTASQYNDIRSKAKAKKDANYARNVAKAGKFQDYTQFYTARGTDTGGAWMKGPTRGHRMVKTKYDYQGIDGVGYAQMKQPEGIEGTTKRKAGAVARAAQKK